MLLLLWSVSVASLIPWSAADSGRSSSTRTTSICQWQWQTRFVDLLTEERVLLAEQLARGGGQQDVEDLVADLRWRAGRDHRLMTEVARRCSGRRDDAPGRTEKLVLVSEEQRGLEMGRRRIISSAGDHGTKRASRGNIAWAGRFVASKRVVGKKNSRRTTPGVTRTKLAAAAQEAAPAPATPQNQLAPATVPVLPAPAPRRTKSKPALRLTLTQKTSDEQEHVVAVAGKERKTSAQNKSRLPSEGRAPPSASELAPVDDEDIMGSVLASFGVRTDEKARHAFLQQSGQTGEEGEEKAGGPRGPIVNTEQGTRTAVAKAKKRSFPATVAPSTTKNEDEDDLSFHLRRFDGAAHGAASIVPIDESTATSRSMPESTLVAGIEREVKKAVRSAKATSSSSTTASVEDSLFSSFFQLRNVAAQRANNDVGSGPRRGGALPDQLEAALSSRTFRFSDALKLEDLLRTLRSRHDEGQQLLIDLQVHLEEKLSSKKAAQNLLQRWDTLVQQSDELTNQVQAEFGVKVEQRGRGSGGGGRRLHRRDGESFAETLLQGVEQVLGDLGRRGR